MAKSTRDRIIRVAEDLFYRDGFHAVGVDRIVAEVGVTKTTFYNHFESKEDLILQVLRKHDLWWRNTFQKMLERRGGPTPLGQLRAIFDVIAEMMTEDTFNGCIFVNVSVEFPLPHDPVHEAAIEHRQAMELLIRDLALRGGVNEPVAFAEQLALLMNGAFLALQITHDDTPLNAARRLAEMLMDKNVPAERNEHAPAESPPAVKPRPRLQPGAKARPRRK